MKHALYVLAWLTVGLVWREFRLGQAIERAGDEL